jgi:hypothetical protein
VGGTATDVWIAAVNNNPERSFIYRLAGNTWKQEADVPCVLRGIAAGDKVAYAAGACNVVFRRDPSGVWKPEEIPRDGAYQIAVVSDTDAYVAADDLLHRDASGMWKPVKAGFPRVHTVARAHGNQVFAIGNFVKSGGSSGVSVGAGDKWTKLDLEDCAAAASTESTTYCVRERIVAAEPPEDLRKH